MEDDEDDLYGAIGAHATTQYKVLYNDNGQSVVKHERDEQDQEEGEAEGEEADQYSDSDIDIITERKPGIKAERIQQPSSTEAVKTEPNRKPSVTKADNSRSTPATSDPSTVKTPYRDSKPGYSYPEVHSSTFDITADNPIYTAGGKPITELDFDADLAEHDKSWRRAGADQSDFFNYGFDEFTWATYCLKQKNMRDALVAQKVESAKFEMMFGGGMPLSASGGQSQVGQQMGQQQVAAGGQGVAGPQAGMQGMNMPGMPDTSPEMINTMMQQMMASGIDPNQMDFGSFMQTLQQMQQGGQGQGFGGQAQGPGMGYSGLIDSGNQGNQGRGRGRRRW